MFSGLTPLSTPLSNETGVVVMKVSTGEPFMVQVVVDVVPINSLNIKVRSKEESVIGLHAAIMNK